MGFNLCALHTHTNRREPDLAIRRSLIASAETTLLTLLSRRCRIYSLLLLFIVVK